LARKGAAQQTFPYTALPDTTWSICHLLLKRREVLHEDAQVPSFRFHN